MNALKGNTSKYAATKTKSFLRTKGFRLPGKNVVLLSQKRSGIFNLITSLSVWIIV